VAFPAFLLGHEPRRRIFAISYGDDLSAKHASDFRSIVHSPWYGRAFPEMQVMRSAENDVTTTLRGFRKATSVSGTLTGLLLRVAVSLDGLVTLWRSCLAHSLQSRP
jgi:hypothetical protein